MHYAPTTYVNGYTLVDEYGIYYANKAVQGEFKNTLKGEVTFGYRIVGSWAFAPRPNEWSKFQEFYLDKHLNKTYHPYVKETPVPTGNHLLIYLYLYLYMYLYLCLPVYL